MIEFLAEETHRSYKSGYGDMLELAASVHNWLSSEPLIPQSKKLSSMIVSSVSCCLVIVVKILI